jgi:SAM-dependent methyltransferase
MHNNAIQRQYDEVIAPHYDLDPQSVIGRALDIALRQIRRHHPVGDEGVLHAIDLGIGTGNFLARLRGHIPQLQPYGIDVSARMIDIARNRLPDLQAAVDDAANLDTHFGDESFDLVCTHFLTGFVPLEVLAPKVGPRMSEGGLWSFIGGTRAGFPVLRRTATRWPVRWLVGGSPLQVDELVCNPADRTEVVGILESHGFAVRACETFEPRLDFKNLDEFLAFAYYGGWLTPFIEALKLHEAGALMRTLLNTLAFPVQDHHSIEVVLAQKVNS